MTTLELIKDSEQRYGGRIGLWAKNYSTGKEIVHRAGEAFGAASLIKIPILVALFRKCEQGVTRLGQTVSLQLKHIFDIPEEAGILKHFPLGAPVSVDMAARMMIYLSDNTATNLVLQEFVTMEEVNRAMRESGYADIMLNVPDFTAKSFAHAKDDIGRGTPKSLGELLGGVALRKALHEERAEKLLSYMSSNYVWWRLTRNLPHHANAGDASPIADYGNKEGTYSARKTISDLAFVRTKNGQLMIFCVMMQGMENADGVLQVAIDSMQNKLFGEIGRFLFEELYAA